MLLFFHLVSILLNKIIFLLFFLPRHSWIFLEKIFYMPYFKEKMNDCGIWSLGCIVFEMSGGIKPFCTNESGKVVPRQNCNW